jgi:hypothetical protein
VGTSQYLTAPSWNSCVASVMRWSGKKATASCRVRRFSENDLNLELRQEGCGGRLGGEAEAPRGM